MSRQELGDAIFAKLKERYDAKEKLIGPDAMRYHERMIMLSVLDSQWKDHLRDMDHLKEGIGLRGYGQHDPLVEYKRESFDMFEAMMTALPGGNCPVSLPDADPGTARSGSGVSEAQPAAEQGRMAMGRATVRRETSLPRWTNWKNLSSARRRRELEQARMAGSGEAQTVQQVVRGTAKVGRNDPCPCGSGKKYKKCCGAQG